MDKGAWRARVHGDAKSWTRLSYSHTHTHTHTECKKDLPGSYIEATMKGEGMREETAVSSR